MIYDNLDEHEHFCIKKALKKSFPHHIGGFEKGWLDIIRTEVRGIEELQVYSNNKLVVSIRP